MITNHLSASAALLVICLFPALAIASAPSPDSRETQASAQSLSPDALTQLSRRDPGSAIIAGKQLLQRDLSPANSATVNLAIAWAYLRQGEYTESEHYTRDALDIAEQYNLPKLRAEAINVQGSLAYRQGQYERAETYYHQTLAIAEQHQFIDRLLAAHSNLGNVYRNLGEPILALDNLHKALRYSEQLDDPWRTGVTEVSMGLIYKDNGQYAAALDRFNHALQLFEQADNELAAVYPLGYSAEIFQLQGKYQQALEVSQKAHEIWEHHKEVDALARSHLTLAKLQRGLKESEAAKQQLEAAQTLYQQLNNSNGQANVLLERGQLALDQQQYEQAQQDFRQALALYKAEDQRTAELETILLIAESWILRNQPKQAESFLKLASARLLENTPPPLAVKVALLNAQTRFMQGRLSSALSYAQQAATHAVLLALFKEARQSHQLLSDIYQQQGNYKAALAAYQTAESYLHRLQAQDQDKNLQLLRAEHQLSQQSEQLEKLNTSKAQMELELAQQSWHKKSLQVTIAVLCVLLLLISALVYQSRRLAKAYEERSLHDPLTQLGNRRFFEQWLNIQLPVMRRRWFQHHSSVNGGSDCYFFMIDLDFFKQVNDHYGHAAGDEVLTQFSRLCNNLLRNSDQLIRMGGEEFLLVAQQVDASGAAQLAEKIRRVVARHNFIVAENRLINITCTLGFAPFPLGEKEPDSDAIEPTMLLADRFLYEAKAQYRNAWMGLGESKGWLRSDLVDADMAELFAAQQRGELCIFSSHPLPAPEPNDASAEPSRTAEHCLQPKPDKTKRSTSSPTTAAGQKSAKIRGKD